MTAIRGVPGVAQVQPPQRSTDGKLIKVDAVLSMPSDSPAAATAVTRIRAATGAIPGANAEVGGTTANSMDKAQAQAHDRRVVIPLVLVVVFVVLALLLRAIVAPVLLILTVLLSYFSALGLSWLLFQHVFGFPAVDVQLMLVGSLFLVALGVDYNIFLVSRIRQEVARHGHRAGVLGGLTVTGGVITSAGAVPGGHLRRPDHGAAGRFHRGRDPRGPGRPDRHLPGQIDPGTGAGAGHRARILVAGQAGAYARQERIRLPTLERVQR